MPAPSTVRSVVIRDSPQLRYRFESGKKNPAKGPATVSAATTSFVGARLDNNGEERDVVWCSCRFGRLSVASWRLEPSNLVAATRANLVNCRGRSAQVEAGSAWRHLDRRALCCRARTGGEGSLVAGSLGIVPPLSVDGNLLSAEQSLGVVRYGWPYTNQKGRIQALQSHFRSRQ